MSRRAVVAVAETVSAAAVSAWVGGQLALGAFTARILFRELPRALAAPTMNAIFRSFDRLIAIAAALLAAATALRLWGRRGELAWSDLVATVAAVVLVTVGLVELAWIHPAIEELFLAGRTLEPAFQDLHRTSSRLALLDGVAALLLLGGFAWRRRA